MAKQTPSQYERLAPIANSADHIVGRREIQVLDQLLAKTRDHHAHPNRNVQFDTQRAIPMHVGLTAGQGSEGQHLRQHLTADCCYVMDRGFQNCQLLADILAAQSDFIVRLRKSATAEVLETRPRTAADQAAGVIADEVVRVGWRSDQTAELPSLRRVIVRAPDRTGLAALREPKTVATTLTSNSRAGHYWL